MPSPGRMLPWTHGEAAVYTARGPRFSGKEVDFGYGLRYDVAGYLDTPLEDGSIAMDIAPTLVLVVPDLTEAEHGLAALGQYPACRWNYGFDTGLPAEKQRRSATACTMPTSGMHDDYTEAHGIRTRTIECRTMNEADFFGTYGGLFCLGIILSLEFLFAAVLIIYYKQISEGYEDQSRFGIMQKVGMTKTEIPAEHQQPAAYGILSAAGDGGAAPGFCLPHDPPPCCCSLT